MPTWSEVLQTLQNRAQAHPQGMIPLDDVRREALTTLQTLTGRPTVVYASRWVQGDAGPEHVMVSIQDVHAFMEVLHGLKGPSLDLILHSSGGSPTAAEAVVNYIRTRFDDVRVIVPLGAMSAATMMACAANTIVLGKHSYLGPTDPQLILETPLGVRAVPAHAIVAQFRLAQSEAANPAQFGAWIPMLQQYGPALIVQCNNVMALGTSMVKDWLERWMFKGDASASAKANLAATQLNDHSLHMVHDRFLNRDFLKGLGLKIEDLEKDQAFQDAVLTVFHAVTHTFQFNGTVTKIVENHLGKAFMSKRAPPPMAAMLPFPVAPPPPQRP